MRPCSRYIWNHWTSGVRGAALWSLPPLAISGSTLQSTTKTILSPTPASDVSSLLSMPHPIFEIDELLRLIVNKLVKIRAGTAVSFALACWSLEEPTLSSLWKEQQHSLINLLKVLPDHTWVSAGYDNRGIVSGCTSFLRVVSDLNSAR